MSCLHFQNCEARKYCSQPSHCVPPRQTTWRLIDSRLIRWRVSSSCKQFDESRHQHFTQPDTCFGKRNIDLTVERHLDFQRLKFELRASSIQKHVRRTVCLSRGQFQKQREKPTTEQPNCCLWKIHASLMADDSLAERFERSILVEERVWQLVPWNLRLHEKSLQEKSCHRRANAALHDVGGGINRHVVLQQGERRLSRIDTKLLCSTVDRFLQSSCTSSQISLVLAVRQCHRAAVHQSDSSFHVTSVGRTEF